MESNQRGRIHFYIKGNEQNGCKDETRPDYPIRNAKGLFEGNGFKIKLIKGLKRNFAA